MSNVKNVEFMRSTIFILLPIIVLLMFISCHNKAVPSDSDHSIIPSNLRITSGYRQLKLYWLPQADMRLAGYKIHYGTESKNYTDTITVNNKISSVLITGLEDNKTYYCALSCIDTHDRLSTLSNEVSAITYLAFEDFSQFGNNLDSTKWNYDIGYRSPVVDNKVGAVEVSFHNIQMMKSFGQYLNFTPKNNFVVECEFQLGLPNAGGAGLMLRSQLADGANFYKGYLAYLYWNMDHWDLRVEESRVDRKAMPYSNPAKIPTLVANEWVKLSVQFQDGIIKATLIRMDDLSILGTVTSRDWSEGYRPRDEDIYTGFFTSQSGRSVIYADNFGIKRAQ